MELTANTVGKKAVEAKAEWSLVCVLEGILAYSTPSSRLAFQKFLPLIKKLFQFVPSFD